MVNVFRVFPHWSVIAWILWMIAFVVLETLGLRRVKGAVPLTWVIRDSVPVWALVMATSWLAYHFVVQKNGTDVPE